MYTFISISGCSIFALPYVWFFLLITQYFDHVVASTRASTLFHLSPEILSSSIWNSYPLIFPNYFESRCWVSKASPGECNLFQHGPSLKAWFKPMNSFLLSLLGTALIHTHTHTICFHGHSRQDSKMAHRIPLAPALYTPSWPQDCAFDGFYSHDQAMS